MKFEYSGEHVLGSSVMAVDLETLLVLPCVRVDYFYKVTTLIVVTSSSMGFKCDFSGLLFNFSFIYFASMLLSFIRYVMTDIFFCTCNCKQNDH